MDDSPQLTHTADTETEVAQVLGVSRATLYRRVPELAEARTQAMMNLDL